MHLASRWRRAPGLWRGRLPGRGGRPVGFEAAERQLLGVVRCMRVQYLGQFAENLIVAAVKGAAEAESVNLSGAPLSVFY